jgi:Asp-tRNA(Asn)/Glu-tRNA(Gln) amidotransferase A subunit family amidase
VVDHDLCYTPATDLVRSYLAREISPVQVVQNSLERIEEVNAALNCFCFVYPEEALAKAKAAEDRLHKGDGRPLEGVPIAIKDFTPTKGKVTTRGSRLLQDWVPDWNPVVVERLEAAGAIMVGKTTTPEFATSGFTDSPLWGITRNPWDPARTPGGSSGGSGAAVASGCVPLAEGTDMGSLRSGAFRWISSIRFTTTFLISGRWLARLAMPPCFSISPRANIHPTYSPCHAASLATRYPATSRA